MSRRIWKYVLEQRPGPDVRLAIGRDLARLATWIAGECPCERCRRIEGNKRLIGTLRRHERRQLARDIVRGQGGGPAT